MQTYRYPVAVSFPYDSCSGYPESRPFFSDPRWKLFVLQLLIISEPRNKTDFLLFNVLFLVDVSLSLFIQSFRKVLDFIDMLNEIYLELSEASAKSNKKQVLLFNKKNITYFWAT